MLEEPFDATNIKLSPYYIYYSVILRFREAESPLQIEVEVRTSG